MADWTMLTKPQNPLSSPVKLEADSEAASKLTTKTQGIGQAALCGAKFWLTQFTALSTLSLLFVGCRCVDSTTTDASSTPLLPDHHGGGVEPNDGGPKANLEDTDRPISYFDYARWVSATNDLGISVYRKLEARGNIVFSPVSLAMSLGMLYQGASGETAAALGRCVLGSLEPDGYGGAIRRMTEEMRGLSMDFAPTQGRLAEVEAGSQPDWTPEARKARPARAAAQQDGAQGPMLMTARSTWTDNRAAPRADYLDRLQRWFNAEHHAVDMEDSTKTSQAINRWVSEKTAGKLAGVVSPQDSFSTEEVLLFDVLAFRGSWSRPFPKARTSPAVFHSSEGGDIRVPMMHNTQPARYARLSTAQAIELSYQRSDLFMLVLLPDSGQFEAVRGETDAKRLAYIDDHLEERNVAVSLPRFRITMRQDLIPAMQECGMQLASSPRADFSRMSEQHPLRIGSIGQQARVEVTEVATEAIAVTGVRFIVTADETHNVATFAADRPFLFYILRRDGPILFMGEVRNPTVE